MNKGHVGEAAPSPSPEQISCETLAIWLATSKKVLLIDCRSFPLGKKRLKGAQPMRINSIKMRRCKGNLPLQDIIPDPDVRSRLENDHFECIVIYDENGITSTCKLVFDNIQKVSVSSRICVLEGGMSSIKKTHPGLIDNGNSAGLSPISVGGKPLLTPLPPKTPSFDESVVDERLRTVKQSEKDKNTPEYDQGPPVNILDHLFLGSAAHAGQLELLKRLGITALLNVSPNCPNHWPDKFVYETIPVEDNSTADIKAHFHKAIRFINKVKEEGGRVLVHCRAGVSRSATLCLAYLISCRGMSLNDAYDEVKRKRRVIAPNFNFMGQLLSWQEEQRLNPLVEPMAELQLESQPKKKNFIRIA